MIIIRKFKYILLFWSLFNIFIISSWVYATDIQINSVDVQGYEEWNQLDDNEKEKTIMPSTYSISIPEAMLEDNLFYDLYQKTKQDLLKIKVGASANDLKFNLNSKISINVKDQGNTESCWAFSILQSMETNMKLKYGTSKDFSERHMDYATSESFYDGVNVNSFNRKVSEGGSSIVGLAYLTNGQGAVLEEQMPFESNMNSISIKDIDINPSYYVKGYELLPNIYKINTNGEVVYTNGQTKIYTYDDVLKIRKIIKQHIIENGGIVSYIASYKDYYSDQTDILKSKAFYCDDIKKSINHAVTIVGWDDNYSRYNFTGKTHPSRDGAYLILNTYSENVFDKGYIWVSYEDAWIEAEMYGITDVSQINYDKIYQHDFFGAGIPLTLASKGKSLNTGYYGSVYSRDKNQNEILNEISISTNQYASFEIYVNSINGDLDIDKMQKVATTGILKPGYNTIRISPVVLTGESYAIAVKHSAVDDVYYFMVEAPVENTFFSKITSEVGDSKVSIDGKKWVNLADLGTVKYSGMDVDLTNADVCIKAFTTYKNITSDDYEISKDNFIIKILDSTSINNFIKNVFISDKNYIFIDKDGNEISDYNSLIKTGMVFKVGDIEYKLAVRGDLNGDGKISLVDLSKHIAHFTGIKNFILYGAYDKASDINLDGSLSIIDVSQFLILYNKM